MPSRTAANRYARALLDVARQEQGDLPLIEQELAAFAQLFTADALLSHVLLNPTVPAPRKGAAVKAAVGHAGVSKPVAKLLILLAERDRLMLLPDVLAAYRDRLLDHQRVVRAEVTTSVPLAADRTDAIRRSLATLTGRHVSIVARVDPGLIGGVVARVGGTVFDGSIARQLERIKDTLTQA